MGFEINVTKEELEYLADILHNYHSNAPDEIIMFGSDAHESLAKKF